MRQDLGLPDVCIQRPQTARGTGGFAKEARSLINTPFSRGTEPRAPADKIVCIADADRPQNLVPKFRPAPPKGDPAVGTWLKELEAAWLSQLVQNARLNEAERSRVETLCLRWSKESLLIAAVDALRAFMDEDRLAEVDAFLEQCEPSPIATNFAPPSSFTDIYRDPQECLKGIFLAGKAKDRSKYDKGRDGDDLLKAIKVNPEFRTLVRARCPDLDRLASALQ